MDTEGSQRRIDYPGGDKFIKGMLECEMRVIESLSKKANCVYRLQVRLEKGGIKNVALMCEEAM